MKTRGALILEMRPFMALNFFSDKSVGQIWLQTDLERK